MPLNQITSEYESGAILIVSHRIIMKVLILTLLGLDASHMANIKLDACGLSVFNFEKDTNRFIMTRFNETCFLNSLKKSPAEDF